MADNSWIYFNFIFLSSYLNGEFSTFTRGDPPKKQNLFINYIFILTFKLQLPSKYSPFDVVYLLRLSPLLKTGFELVYFDAF